MAEPSLIRINGDEINRESVELALRASHEGIWDWHVGDEEIRYSERILEFLECPLEKAPNLFIEPFEAIHAGDRETFSHTLRSALEANGPEILATDARVHTGGGNWRWLRIRGMVVRDEHGNAKRIAGSMIDISKRKHAEAQLEDERYQLRQLTDHIPVQVYFKDLDSRFVMANQRMAEWIGLKSADDLLGKHDCDFFDEDHWKQAHADERQIIESGKPIMGQLEHETRREGGDTWVVTSKFPWRGRMGQIKGTFGVSSDVTKLVLAQREATELAEQLASKNETYEEELQLAREIQQALSFGQLGAIEHQSRQLRFASRYVPISGLAGDFYEVIEISPAKVGVLICDVMGHGVRSALIVAMLRGLIEKQDGHGDEPAQFLNALNEGLAAILERAGVTMFATAFYGVIDLESNQLHYSSAGHPGPIVVDQDGPRQITTKKEDKGPGLGLIRKAHYPSHSMDISQLKRLVLFTDGVLEAENRKGEPFFEKRLLEIINRQNLLGIEELLDSILSSVLDFSKDHHFDDDVCLLAVDFMKK